MNQKQLEPVVIIGVLQVMSARLAMFYVLHIMAAAVKLVLAFGFEKMRLDSVVAYTAADNKPSIKVLENVGFEWIAAEGEMLIYCMENWRPSG